MPRKIVDSNFLGSPDLTAYLQESRSNRIVLTEFILMEQFKEHAAINVRRSFERCSAFASQVTVLLRSPEILRMGLRQNLARNMIDATQTNAFPGFCAGLTDPARREIIDRHIAHREAESAAHMAQLLDDAKHVPAIFDRITTAFTQSEMREIRDEVPMSHDTQKKLLAVAMDQARDLYEATAIEERYWPRTVSEGINGFPFRYSLCLILLFRRWVVGGKQRARAPEKVCNDIVDANTAAFGTYFGGVLSRDRTLLSVHAEARWMIRSMRGYVAG